MLPSDTKQDEEFRRKLAQEMQPHVCVCRYSPGYEGECKLKAEIERLRKANKIIRTLVALGEKLGVDTRGQNVYMDRAKDWLDAQRLEEPS